MFESLLQSSPVPRNRSKRTLAASLFAHAVLVAAIIVAPLIYYQAIPGHELLTFLASPPPTPAAPPPPPPPVSASQPELQVVRVDPAQWIEPQRIPDRIPPAMEDIPILQNLEGMSAPPGPGGGRGFVPIPHAEALIGVPTDPPPPPAIPKEPLRVVSTLQASRLVHRVEPEYPELARRTRVQGMVLLQVTVNERGLVSRVDVLRGHRLLNQAAVDAVRQWRYSPTLLNDEPVPVIATVTVTFVLR